MRLSSEELARREALKDLAKETGRGRFKVTRKYIQTKENIALNKELEDLIEYEINQKNTNTDEEE